MIPRSTVIEKSLGCFDYGIVSLIPVVGVFAVPFALVNFQFAIVETNDRWNPARWRLYAGMAFALLSLLAHAIAGVVLFLAVIRAYQNV